MKQIILDAFSDILLDFLLYDRKELYTELQVYDIEDAIISGIITIEDFAEALRTELVDAVKERKEQIV